MAKRYGAVIIGILAELAVGVLLLMNPVGFTKAIIMGIGAVILVIGAYKLITYLLDRRNSMESPADLTLGAIACVIGIILLAGNRWILATFSVITLFYGILMLIGGISKLSQAAEMRRNDRRWLFSVISACITIAAAVIIIANPFSTTALLWRFIGASLIIEAVIDLVVIIHAESAYRKLNK